jgi:hypothetical protein
MSTMRTIIEAPMKMHNPPYPGEIIRQLCLEPLGMTVTDAASALGGKSQDVVCAAEWSGRYQSGDGGALVDRVWDEF